MVEVRRKEYETAGSLLRRFTRRVQQSGVLIHTRKHRFWKSKMTKREMRERALRRIQSMRERERLAKLGKLPEPDRRM